MTAVDIYTTNSCPYCAWAKELLVKKGIPFHEIDVTGKPAMRAEMTERARGRTSVPGFFVGETHVGGCDDLYALDDAGGLDPLLQQTGATA